MKKIINFLIALLATFSATAVNYFTIGGVVNDTLLINPLWIGTGQMIPVGAHFDGRVDQWTVTITYPDPDSLDIINVAPGSDMHIPYIANGGIDSICHAPLTVSDNYTIIASIITEFGYWDRYNNGNYESYGTVKWEAGDYPEMFLITSWFYGDLTGDSITLSSSVYGTWDWRGGTTNGMFVNKIYLKVGYQRGDVNGDGKVNINDVTELNRYLLLQDGLDQYQLEAADVNCDGNVTINDVTTLINILLQNGQINETDLESDM